MEPPTISSEFPSSVMTASTRLLGGRDLMSESSSHQNGRQTVSSALP